MKNLRKIFYAPLVLFFPLLLTLFTACKESVDYSSFVSEYRRDIFLAQTDGYSLTAFFSFREYPYAADGVCAERQDLAEIYLTVPDNAANYEISFSLDGKTYGGETSYDNVYGRFFYSQSVPATQEKEIVITVACRGESVTLIAKSVKSGNELTMSALIDKLTEQKKVYFDSLTEGNNFCGEIYIRLVYEDKVYYFIRVSQANGNGAYFLLDGETGTLLAEKINNGA